MHLALIGNGSIARSLLTILDAQGAAPARIDLLCRPGRTAAARQAIGDRPELRLHEDPASLIAAGPELVVEAASQQAVAELLPPCLEAGLPAIVVSVGALADAATSARLEAACAAGGGRVTLCSGAIGGLDIIGAARLAGIESLRYTSRKPPMAWRGTPAEAQINLAALSEATVFFRGTAREAALAYPKNANVAATVALAGPGLDQTEVVMIADPAATGNHHAVEMWSAVANLSFDIESHQAPDNPRTSASTAFALARSVMAGMRPIAF